MSAASPLVSAVITTRNRSADLRVAIESCLGQDYAPFEVLVLDDASSDDTHDVVRECYPDVRYLREEQNVGLVALRNRGFREARGKYVFTLDDDAYYSDPTSFEKTIAVFQAEPGVGAVALPLVEPYLPHSLQFPRYVPGQRLGGFRGGVNAIRRDVFENLNGYRDFYFRQEEEREFAMRLLNAGFDIVYGGGDPVVHLASPRRDQYRQDFYEVRNTLLTDMFNVPHPFFLPRYCIDLLQLFCLRFRLRNLPQKVNFTCRALAATLRYRHLRKPILVSSYRRFRSLPKHYPVESSANTIPQPCRRRCVLG